eukprot:7496147-Heterocapsa_arctica.AAC.1
MGAEPGVVDYNGRVNDAGLVNDNGLVGDKRADYYSSGDFDGKRARQELADLCPPPDFEDEHSEE